MAPILPPAVLGLLGGGQLGRFFVHAAHELGYRVWVLDPDPESPAGRIADRHLASAYQDRAALDLLAGACASVTTEFENVPAATLEQLARSVPVRPGAASVAICQDRIAEKTFLREQGIPHAPFAVIRTEEDVRAAKAALFPGILKVARFGYDGKGQVRVQSRDNVLAEFRKTGGEPCVLEALLPLDAEVSVVLARDAAGNAACFPLAENRHRHGILDVSIVPARVSAALGESARQYALKIAAALDYTGTLGVEFFISGGRLFVNEMAPRPHNSGHYTLDACVTSQYEQQVRALCGLPLGNPAATGAAVMVNLLGDLWFDERGASRQPDWARLLAEPDLRLHLYGKHEARRSRKMGHFTVVGPDPGSVLATALAARKAIGIMDEPNAQERR